MAPLDNQGGAVWSATLMSTVLLALALTPGADDEFAQALKALSTAESYSFTVKDAAGAQVEGTYQKGSPLHLRADRIEFFRRGDILVYRQGDSWQRTRTGTLSDPLPILGASARVKALRPPHEEVARLSAGMTDVRKTTGKEGTMYMGVLLETAAKDLVPSEDRDLARGGTATVRVDDKGRLTGYEVSIQVRGRRGNADVDGTVTRTVTVKELGTAKVEVPAAAKKALE
jgi:hypothetical protein